MMSLSRIRRFLKRPIGIGDTGLTYQDVLDGLGFVVFMAYIYIGWLALCAIYLPLEGHIH